MKTASTRGHCPVSQSPPLGILNFSVVTSSLPTPSLPCQWLPAVSDDPPPARDPVAGAARGHLITTCCQALCLQAGLAKPLSPD